MKKVFLFVITIFATIMLIGCNGTTDKETYQIIIPEQETIVRKDGSFDSLKDVKLVDSKGSVSDKYEIVVTGALDLTKEGTYTLTYSLEEEVEHEPVSRTVEVAAVTVTGAVDVKISVGDTNFSLTSGIIVSDPILGDILASSEENANYFTIKVDDGNVTNFQVNVVKEYTITYIYNVDDFELEFQRNVNVVREATIVGIEDARVLVKSGLFDPYYRVSPRNPVINDEGEVIIEEIDSMYLVVEGWDEFDPDELGIYTLVYKIENPENPIEFLKDAEGNDLEFTRNVEVYNEVKLYGASSKSVTVGTTDFDPMDGVRALDTLDGDITDQVVVTGADDINFDKVGDYSITYFVEGSGEVTQEVTVVISIVEEISGKQTIRIMAGDLREVDPFHPNFSGSNQAERQALQRAAEAKHNVEIEFVPYPDNAAWGPARVNAMIEAAITGHHLSDFYYHITTDWLRDLVQGGALAPIDKYIDDIGSKIHSTQYEAGEYNGKHYTFNPGALTLADGLFFNVDLLNSLDIPNPADLYNQGNWTWNGFEQWVESANAKLKGTADDYYALGGVIYYYAMHMVPLNGGQFIDLVNERVAFTDQEALDTFGFIHNLHDKNYFEPSPVGDAGSDEWKNGKVLIHPGELWFVNADNRWGDLDFELGYVPYPMSDDFIAKGGEFISPQLGIGVVVMSSGMTPEREELAFKVWMDLQIWNTDDELKEAYENGLKRSFDDIRYIDIMLENFDKVYLEIINSLVEYPDRFRDKITPSIRTGDYDTRLREIVPTHEYALRNYLKND